jgi:diguanylate cyclase (GGDEF)-like protein
VNNNEYNPYLALKTITEMTANHRSKEFLEIAGNQIALMFKSDLVLIKKVVYNNATRKVKVLYSSDPKYNENFLSNTPCQLVLNNKIVNISKGVKKDFLGMKEFLFESYYGIPIMDENDGKYLGHIAIYSKETRTLGIEFEEVALIYARVIHAYMNRIMLESENKKTKSKLEKMIIRDPLTNLFNKKHFLSSCENVLSKVKRNDSIATLTYLYLDDFQSITDKFGHNAGDVVLESFAKIMIENIRKGLDIVFRLGGEEFCILSTETSSSKSTIQQRRILKKTEKYFTDSIYSPVTVSIGIIEINNDFENVNHIIQLADEKMYKAKKMGKNRIVS